MTSATEDPRRMLTDAGVEWDADDEIMDDGSISQVTYWYSNGIEWSADGRDKYLAFDAVQLITPAQAIAATVGAGTCHDKGDPNDFCCSECGMRMYTDTNDTYTMIASDGRTIIKHPNFCPNCGAKVVNK